jgi:hypothetical protein
MTLPTDALGVYDLLAADVTLAALLGTYLTAQGTTMPAIATLWPGESLPGGTVARGVEVVIARGTTGTNEPDLTDGGTIGRTIRLYATQWEPVSGAQNLEAAVARIGRILPGATWQPVSLPDGLTGLGQYAIRWEQSEAVVWQEN